MVPIPNSSTHSRVACSPRCPLGLTALATIVPSWFLIFNPPARTVDEAAVKGNGGNNDDDDDDDDDDDHNNNNNNNNDNGEVKEGGNMSYWKYHDAIVGLYSSITKRPNKMSHMFVETKCLLQSINSHG